jgi:hypothetical protein
VPAAKTGLPVTAASTTNTIRSPSDDGDTCSLQNFIIVINVLDGEFTKFNSIHHHQDTLKWLYFSSLFCFSPFGKSVYSITMKNHNEGTAASEARYTTLQKFLQHSQMFVGQRPCRNIMVNLTYMRSSCFDVSDFCGVTTIYISRRKLTNKISYFTCSILSFSFICVLEAPNNQKS